MVKESIRTGLSFGLTSGIITTLGLLIGLASGTNSKLAVIGGILTIAIADAFSDALGIHISEESQAKHTEREIWESTITTFAAKFFFASIFIAPILLLSLPVAAVVSIIIGLALISIISFFVARAEGIKPSRAIAEHVAVAIVVIIATYYVGKWIARIFS
ncbi:MAG: hypothetical protein QME63_00185 [Actinomycetota bacterium]|nr:hypothetical protein [Actinomycetota bacterium]